jgi:hypothetical protein
MSRERGNGRRVRSAPTLQFRLIYRGPLKASGGPKEKHRIRRALHPQLRDLWQHPPLSGGEFLRDTHDEPPNLSKITRSVRGFNFISFISEHMKLVAEVEIVLLRPSVPGDLIRRGGDIDNQLKTLFDALRAPRGTSELPSGEAPGPNEDPFFCVLEDDERIVDVRVSVDRLLDPPEARSVHAIVFVRTRPTVVTYGNLGLA